MRITYPIVILLLFACSLHAQNEGNIWFFGTGYGIDFSSGAPVATFNSNMNTFEGSASYCDADGNLLFYSNGGGRTHPSQLSTGGIWDRNADLIHDMMGLQGGGYSAPQSSIITPNPANPNQYYLFTMEESEFDIDGIPEGQEQGRGFSYFVIDMTLNGGLGGLVVEDENVHVPSYESLEAVLHGNGTDYWIIIVDSNTNDFFVYLLNNDGVSAPTLRARASNRDISLPIKVSPSRGKMFEDRILYNFNRNTGAITNPRVLIDQDVIVLGASFSHNSQYLYYVLQESNTATLKRFDTNADDIVASEETIHTLTDVFSAHLQLAPDGKIYWNTVSDDNNENHIHAINCPNTASPSVTESVLVFPPPAFYGLPNFTDHIFINDFSFEIDLGEDQSVDCEDFPILLDAQNPDASFLWSTGDTTQTISVTQGGTYSVTITSECGAISDEILIDDNNDIPTAVIAGETALCPGTSTQLMGASNENVTYQWSTGDTTAVIDVDKPDLYILTVTDACGAENIDSIEVFLLEESIAGLEGIFAICEGTSTLINANSPGALDYAWSTGDNTASATITTGGTYTVTITNVCESIDTTFFIEETALPTIDIQADAVLCPGEEKRLEVVSESVADYSWSTGQTTPDITAREWGLYTVEGSNECGTALDSLLLQPFGCDNCLYIPNAFSPNEDGRNDLFIPIAVCPLEDFEMKVFSRWGALMYETQSLDNGWDGTFKGEKLGSDVFAWFISYTQAGQQIRLEGDISLIR
jgi:gliding motility-associated-like protein